jgi:hypothetical protein
MSELLLAGQSLSFSVAVGMSEMRNVASFLRLGGAFQVARKRQVGEPHGREVFLPIKYAHGATI